MLLFEMFASSLLLSATVWTVPSYASKCRFIPGDAGWPSPNDWASLNTSVGGRLIATIPQASVCHRSPFADYNATTCQTLANAWDLAQTFEPHPAEIINAYYQNQSCDPFTPELRPCELGNYAAYSINVSSADDVVAGIKFAEEKNVRLVIKTTGHDYLGKSTGLGALSLWTWNLKTADIIPQYNSSWYSGPAIKLGSGMIAGDAMAVAHQAGYRIVGGECGSVGIAAGYSQGGGHSILATEYGMAADQILEWEVITSTGDHLVATPEKNQDLYWALSGGGGGTWGVVLHMTTRLHPDGPISGGTLGFANTDDTVYWEALRRLFQMAPTLVGENNTIFFTIENTGFDAISMTLPDQPVEAVPALLGPFLADLKELNITYSLNTTTSSNYYDHFDEFFGPLPYGHEPPSTILTNRLVPRALIESENATSALMQTLRGVVTSSDFFFGCFFINVNNSNSSHPDNAVLPAWRSAAVACNVNALWNYTAPIDTNLALKRELVETIVPALEAATPGGGMYLNEMDPWYQGQWKENLYGQNYDRLQSIKHRYDPSHLFWGNFSVASDELFIDDNGRLCSS